MAAADLSMEPIAIWCHICNENQNGVMNDNTHEIHCIRCERTFVETLGQGIEEFISNSQTNRSSELARPVLASSGVRASSGGDRTIFEIMDSILEIGVATNPRTQSSTVSTVTAIPSGNTQPLSNFDQDSSNTSDVNSTDSRPAENVPQDTSEESRVRMPFVPATRRSAPPTRRRSVTDLLDALLGLQRMGRNDSGTSNAELEQILHHILMHEQSRVGVPPASASAINDLPRVVVSSENLDQHTGDCNISLEPFVEGDVCVSLPCGHKYKEGQIIKWLEMHATCPVCRITIPSQGSS